MKTNIHFLFYLAQFFLEWEMFQTNDLQVIKTRILHSITFSFEYRAFDEIMWKNTLEPDMPQMTIWRMRVAYWIPKATNTHTQNL
jgi:hypothetical protein